AERLQVPVGVLDARCFVGDHDDVIRHRLAEYLLDGVGLEWHHGQGVDAGREHVLQDSYLGVGVGLAGSLHIGIGVGGLGVANHTLFHPVEPGDASELGHGDDRRAVAARRAVAGLVVGAARVLLLGSGAVLGWCPLVVEAAAGG